MHETKGTVAIDALGDTKVFQPLKIGANTLKHRVVYAPSTRHRALDNHVPSDLMKQFYDDRTKVPGTLVIAEATHISPRAGLFKNTPGIWNEEQVKGWSKVVDAVHKNGSFISLQLWSLGRAADPAYMKELGLPGVTASGKFMDEDSEAAYKASGTELKPLTKEEIQDFVKKDFVVAAKNAIAAGFDYVEVHSAHGYLLDQFLEACSNDRTDEYGGSIENRARFALEVIDELLKHLEPEQLAIRISPWMDFQGMKGADEAIHPYVTFGYLVNELQRRANAGKELAYLSIVEPRFSKAVAFGAAETNKSTNSNQFILDIWKGKLLRAGNYAYDIPHFEGVREDIKDDRTLVGFSRYFISNPDLPDRLKNGHPLIPYDRSSFYLKSNYGYNTFPRYGKEVEVDEEKEREVVAQPLE